MNSPFTLQSPFSPTGDQPQAIQALTSGLNEGLMHQTLLGVTGSGKTFTMANIIAKTGRPAIIMAHNKTLAAQLYGEFKQFFPGNAVEYFVSYYDYYQPEAYVPATGTFIDKDMSINEHIEQMRLSATKSILERKDTIIVASVSAIYGLGDVNVYMQMLLHLKKGEKITERQIIRQLASMQYTRSTLGTLDRGQYRSRGETIDIFSAESSENALRITLFDDEVESLTEFDPMTGKTITQLSYATVYPKSHYVTPKAQVQSAIKQIRADLATQIQHFKDNNLLIEAQRIEERTRFDLEMLDETGYCKGIENYSRYLSGRNPGDPPPTFFDYLPNDMLMFVDESHVTIPQIGAMYKGDRSRKENLVRYGFRLPSALDNRPLTFDEWQAICPQNVMISATPSTYEAQHCATFVEQLIRPTGILDPQVEIRPTETQADDLVAVVKAQRALDSRVLATVLTKKLAEALQNFCLEHGLKAAYLHADVDTVERMEIIQALRLGTYDVLIGINLLREGLDIPEVSTVCILDADKEGFLRSTRSLVQTIGRAARHLEGRAILYADRITRSMQEAMDETERRRAQQGEYNQAHGITPKAVSRKNKDVLEGSPYLQQKAQKMGKSTSSPTYKSALEEEIRSLDDEARAAKIAQLRKEMKLASEALEFEKAAGFRNEIQMIQKIWD